MKKKRKLKIGILSDSPFITTGYSTISTKVANILSAAGHEVVYFAHTYMGQNQLPGTTFEDNKRLNFKIIGGGREAYFKDVLSIYTKKYKLDVLFILLDTFMLYPWLPTLDLSPAKTIFYFPSDGGSGMPLNCEQILKFVDRPVAMAKYGRDQVKKMHNIDTGYIPHAVEVDNYYPLPDIDKQKLKEKWGLNGKFVIGTVARNQGRKMMDRTLKAFAIYARKDPNAILFMHTDPNDAAQVFSMGNLINRYQLQNRVVFSGTTYFSGFDYKKMNEVYNVMDVFLLTTSGEGFGIPIIEAMACEVPVLATNYTTTKELVMDHNAGLGINLVGVDPLDHPDVHTDEILDGTITGSWDVERGICSITDCSLKLEWMKKHPKEMEIMGKNGREAVLKYYDWNVVDKDWLKVIEELGNEY